MATLAGSSLNNIKDFSLEVLNLADAEFRKVTQAIDSGGTLTMAQMTKYQAEVSQYSLISQIMSAVVKELVDKLTSIENEMGLLRETQKEILNEYEEGHGVDVKALKAALRIAKIRARLGDSTSEADQMLEYIDE